MSEALGELAELEKFTKEYLVESTVMLESLKLIEGKFEVWAFPDPKAIAYHMRDEKEDKSYIFISSAVSKTHNVEKRDLQEYINLLMLHETGHHVFTERIRLKLEKKLKETKVPHSAWNLGEDIYTEANTKKYMEAVTGRKFSFPWDKYQRATSKGHPANMSPEKILWQLRISEGRDIPKAILSREVMDFYTRYKEAKNSLEVVDICAEWRNRFHLKNPKQPKCKGGDPEEGQGGEPGEGQEGEPGEGEDESQSEGQDQGGSQEKNEEEKSQGTPQSDAEKSYEEAMKELEDKIRRNQKEIDDGGEKEEAKEDWGENSLDAAEEDAIKEKSPESGVGKGMGGFPDDSASLKDESPSLSDMLNISIQANGPLSNNEATTPFKIDTSRDTTTLKEGSNGKIFSKSNFPEGQVLKGEMEQIEAALAKIKGESRTRKISTDEPNSTFDELNLAYVDIDPGGEIYSEEKRQKEKRAKIKIVVLMDFSGSMGGYPAHAQRTLSVALNRLVLANRKMDITLIGTKVGDRKPISHALKLPANEMDLICSRADGAAEGITEGLNLNKERLRHADHIVFMTDGNVHGEELSRENIRGIVGKGSLLTSVYLGRADIHSKKLETEFDNFIFKPFLKDVVLDLVKTFNMNGAVIKRLKKIEHSSVAGNIEKNMNKKSTIKSKR